MGWFRRIKDPVRGTARVVAASPIPYRAASGRGRYDIVISVPGQRAYALEAGFLAKVSKWPTAGQVLPVEVSLSNREKFKVMWDEVSTSGERAAAQAEQLAEHLNDLPVSSSSPDAVFGGHTSVTINGQPASLGDAEALVGQDIQDLIARALGSVGGGVEGTMVNVGSGDDAIDRVEALERLAALRANGTLTTAEFEAEKARLLGN